MRASIVFLQTAAKILVTPIRVYQQVAGKRDRRSTLLPLMLLLCGVSAWCQTSVINDQINAHGYYYEMNFVTNNQDCGEDWQHADKPFVLFQCAEGADDMRWQMRLNETLISQGTKDGNPAGYQAGTWEIRDIGGQLYGFSDTYRFDCWEEDGGNNWAFDADDDDPCGNSPITVSYSSVQPGSPQTVTNSCVTGNGNYARFKYMWRYAHGDSFTDALDFGTLNTPNGSWFFHSNRVRTSGTYGFGGTINNPLEYTNVYGTSYGIGGNNYFSSKPEIVYKFNTSACGKIHIWADNDANLILHILKMNGTQPTQYIAGIQGSEVFYDWLGAGSYAVVVEETESGSATSYFTLNIDSDIYTAPSPGSIVYGGYTQTHKGYNIPNMASAPGGNPTGTYETRIWQISWDGTNYSDIVGATATNYNPPADSLVGTRHYRRTLRTPDCGVEVYTSPITITTYDLNGNVSGTVQAPGGSPISNAMLTIENIDPLTGFVGTWHDTAYTDNDGGYTISYFYAGGPSDKNYRVTPHFLDHVFDPPYREFAMNSVNKYNIIGKNFTDVTSFSFSGTVYQQFNGEQCGMPGVLIQRQGPGGTVILDTTDVNGQYSIAIPQIGIYTITPIFTGHTFSPAFSGTINSDMTNVNFQDYTTRQLAIDFKTTCGQPIGKAIYHVYDSLLCISYNDTTDINGLDLRQLPARKYNIEITGLIPVGGASPDYFNNALVQAQFIAQPFKPNLTNADTTLTIVFHPHPKLIGTNWPESPCPDITYGVLPIHTTRQISIQPYSFPPGALPGYPQGCLLDDGILFVEDNIGSYTGLPLVGDTAITGISIVYPLKGGVPSLVSPYTKSISFALFDGLGQLDTMSRNIIVEGNRPRNPSFATVSPKTPLYILRDPPGDRSYATLLQGKSSRFKTRFRGSTNTQDGFFIKQKIDYEFEPTNTKVWGSLAGADIQYVKEVANDTTLDVQETVMTEYSTTDEQEPEAIGGNADVFVGAAFNMIYAISDVVEVNTQRCEVTRREQLTVDADSFATTFVYSAYHIKHNLIPDLRNKIIANLNPDSTQYWENQVAIWESHVNLNDSLKTHASVVLDNFTKDGNTGPLTKTITKTSESSFTSEWTEHWDTTASGSLGGVFLGFGAEAGFNHTNQLVITRDEIADTTSTQTVRYVILDDDEGDAITVDVLDDSTYPCPVFRTRAAETSCPYEAGSLPRHTATLTAAATTLYQVPPGQPAIFYLTLTNISEAADTMPYYLIFNDVTNVNNADVDWHTEDEIPRLLAPFESQTVEIHVFRNQFNGVYSYEGLEFKVFAGCDIETGTYFDDNIVLASLKLNAHFQAPCSAITLAEPEDGWLVTSNTGDTLDILLKDYDVNNITTLTLQWAPIGSTTWNLIQNVPLASLNPNPAIGTVVKWNSAATASVSGQYKIRARIVCPSATVYSSTRTGIIEKTPPYVVGYPAPVDHSLTSEANLIYAVFNELIDQNTGSNNVTLTNSITGLEYSVNTIVAGATLYVNPDVDLTSLPPATYNLVFSGVKDKYGNAMLQDKKWWFTVKNYGASYCDDHTVFYVDGSLNPSMTTHSGASWANAFVNLQEALWTACPGSTIYVAEGTYYPTDSAHTDPLVGDNVWFEWTHAYNLYGGFPSGGAAFEYRNPALYPTILSGDANKNGIRDAGDCHTILKIRPTVNAHLEGFILEGAYADGLAGQDSSGAVYNSGNVTAVNCIFRKNIAESSGVGSGGAWYNNGGNATIVNSLFHDNSASQQGGAITASVNGSLNLINCVFSQNTALFGSALNLGSLASIVNTIFFGNNADPDKDFNKFGSGAAIVSYSSFGQDTLPAWMTVDAGTTLLNTDPLFVNPINNNFNLQPGSPCIDFGYNTAIANQSETDLNGEIRIVNALTPIPALTAPLSRTTPALAIVDLGPYEKSPCDVYSTADVLHVDAFATSGMSGLSWSEPLKSLASAFKIAETCGVDTILVAEGTYLPATIEVNERLATFMLLDGMTVLGGYPSGGGIRNPREHQTILNGNLGDLLDDGDNAYHVVTVGNTVSPTTLDGVTITGGNANVPGNERGGGVYTVSTGYGKISSAVLSNIVLKNNQATYGGGIATYADQMGENRTSLVHAILSDNTASIHGGAMYSVAAANGSIATPVLDNALVVRNRASQFGGAIYSNAADNSQSAPIMTNVTCADNVADQDNNGSGSGGAIASTVTGSGMSTVRVYNSILWNNFKGNALNEVYQPASADTVIIAHSDVKGGYAGSGNMNTDPVFAGRHVGNYRLDSWSPAINKGDNVKVLQSLDLDNHQRLVSKVDLGAYEYDGTTTRSHLPEALDPVILNCEKPVNLEIPSDGVTYSLWTNSLSQKLDGKDIGDEPLKYLTNGGTVTYDTSFAVIVSRDSSYAFIFNSTPSELSITHDDALEVDGSDVFRASVRIKPELVTGVQYLWNKEGNIGFGLNDNGIIFSAYGVGDIVSPSLGILPNVWTDLTYEYVPQDDDNAILRIWKDGVLVWTTAMSKAIEHATSDALIGSSVSGTEEFQGQMDYLALEINNETVVQYDFLSAAGSDIAYDLSMTDGQDASLGVDTDPATSWVPGHDNYVTLAKDTLKLDVAMTAGQATRYVMHPDDAGYQTLRYEIANACPLDTIRFASVMMGDTVKFESEIYLDKDLFIEGLGMDVMGTVLDGQGMTRLFQIPQARVISFKDMQMIGGEHASTGGAFVASEDCTLWNVKFNGHNVNSDQRAVSTTPASQLTIKGEVQLK